MKKAISIILSAVLFFGLISITPAFEQKANADTEGIFTYIVTDGKATITDCVITASGEITIPDTLGGYPVIAIGDSAFLNCTSITSIIIPSSVTSIGQYAFDYCISLSQVNLPKGITKIENSTFYDCLALTSIAIPEGVTSIGIYAFCLCGALEDITIPGKVSYIGVNAFYCCYKLKDITVQSGNLYYKSIDGVLFSFDNTHLIIYPESKDSLSDYTIPSGVIYIDKYAFYDCKYLKNIVLPETVMSIGDCAFRQTNITSINIPYSVSSLGADLFSHNENLSCITVDSNNNYYKSIDGLLYNKSGKTLVCYPAGKQDSSFFVPDTVEIIGKFAFRCCNNLTTIYLPDSVKIIDDYAFDGCNYVTNIVLGHGVTSIGNNAFSCCGNLQRLDLPNSLTHIGMDAFDSCAFTSVIIPDNITSIDFAVFVDCSNLTSIFIPDSVTYIDPYAFVECSQFTIFCKSDSYAQTFASENSIEFEIIDESINNEYSLNIANPIYDSASNSVNLSVAINNPNLKATNARIIIAVYDFSGELVKLKGTTDENILLYGVETTTLQRSIEISGGLPAGYTVKAFLWNDQMKPLAIASEQVMQ